MTLVIASAHMSVAATIGAYAGIRLSQRGPVGVFPGTVKRLCQWQERLT